MSATAEELRDEAAARAAQKELAARLKREAEAAAVKDWPGSGSIDSFLKTTPPPIQWFARERLLAGRAHLLVGLGGSSKTRLLYHLGIGGVLGRVPWDWPVEQTGSVALFLAEDTADGVHRTIHAMAESMGLGSADRALLAQRLRVFPLAGKSSRLLSLATGGALAETGRLDKLMAAIASLPPPVVFVGLDPALGLTEGDEMNPAHQRRLGELADKIAIDTGACVVLTAHAAKASAMADEVGTHASRGSGAITDAVRGEFVLRTMTAVEARQYGVVDIEERRSFVQLAATKGNEMPPSAFAPLWLRRTFGGVLAPAALDRPDVSINLVGPRELKALDILRKLAETTAPTLKAWREACVEAEVIHGGKTSHGPTQRAVEKAMERIRNALLAAGRIEAGIGRGVFVPVAEA